jgi:hypothetical protein
MNGSDTVLHCLSAIPRVCGRPGKEVCGPHCCSVDVTQSQSQQTNHRTIVSSSSPLVILETAEKLKFTPK